MADDAQGDLFRMRLPSVVKTESAPPTAVLRGVPRGVGKVSVAGALGRFARARRFSSTGGQGRVRPARPVAGGTRRVIVKARVIRMGPTARAALLRHVGYVQRDGVTREGEAGQHFDAATDRTDAKAYVDRCEDDRHHFRFIVSPEDGAELTDLKSYARELMTRMEKNLGTRLDWIAGEHHDTGKPHLHIVVRGKRDDERDLVNAHVLVNGLAAGMLRLGELLGQARASVGRKSAHRRMVEALEGEAALASYLKLVDLTLSVRGDFTAKTWADDALPQVSEIADHFGGGQEVGDAVLAFVTWPDEVELAAGDVAYPPRTDNVFSYPPAEPKVHIRLGSIHSVKGETHTATLVLDTFFHAHHLNELKPWLLGAQSGGLKVKAKGPPSVGKHTSPRPAEAALCGHDATVTPALRGDAQGRFHRRRTRHPEGSRVVSHRLLRAGVARCGWRLSRLFPRRNFAQVWVAVSAGQEVMGGGLGPQHAHRPPGPPR